MNGDLLDDLNPFAVEFRYPGEAVTVEEVKAAEKVNAESETFYSQNTFPCSRD